MFEAKINIVPPADKQLEIPPAQDEEAREEQRIKESAKQDAAAGGSGTQSEKSLHQILVEKLRGHQNASHAPVTLLQKCVAEMIGTAILVTTGVASVCVAVTTGSHIGLWQTAVIWGFGGSIAILASASVSGGHINPAVSFGFAMLRPADFSFKEMFCYWCSQMIGGVLGGIINYLLFSSALETMERSQGIVRGEDASILTAMCFGAYYPNPTMVYSGVESGNLVANAATGWSENTVNAAGAFAIELWCGAVLMFTVFAVTDSRSTAFKNKEMAPYFIGFTIAMLIALFGPFTQGSFNPARDFGPRIAAAMFGWGSIAIPGPKYEFLVYLFAPSVGAVLGGALYEFVLARGLRKQATE